MLTLWKRSLTSSAYCIDPRRAEVTVGRSQPSTWPRNGSDEIVGQVYVALSLSEQADEEGPHLRVVGHAGPALLLRSMDLDRRSEKATGLVCDNLSPSYTRLPLARPCVEPGSAE